LISTAPDSGADSQIRTGDLILTKASEPLFYNDLGRVLFHFGEKRLVRIIANRDKCKDLIFYLRNRNINMVYNRKRRLGAKPISSDRQAACNSQGRSQCSGNLLGIPRENVKDAKRQTDEKPDRSVEGAGTKDFIFSHLKHA